MRPAQRILPEIPAGRAAPALRRRKGGEGGERDGE